MLGVVFDSVLADVGGQGSPSAVEMKAVRVGSLRGADGVGGVGPPLTPPWPIQGWAPADLGLVLIFFFEPRRPTESRQSFTRCLKSPNVLCNIFNDGNAQKTPFQRKTSEIQKKKEKERRKRKTKPGGGVLSGWFGVWGPSRVQGVPKSVYTWPKMAVAKVGRGHSGFGQSRSQPWTPRFNADM